MVKTPMKKSNIWKAPEIIPKTEKTFITFAINFIFLVVAASKVKLIEPVAVEPKLLALPEKLEKLPLLLLRLLLKLADALYL